MRRIIAVLLMVFLVGCGADPFGRLDVNDGLRAACWFLSDVEIQAAITTVEGDRLAGYTVNQEALGAAAGCAGLTDCYSCLMAVVRQLYAL